MEVVKLKGRENREILSDIAQVRYELAMLFDIDFENNAQIVTEPKKGQPVSKFSFIVVEADGHEVWYDYEGLSTPAQSKFASLKIRNMNEKGQETATQTWSLTADGWSLNK